VFVVGDRFARDFYHQLTGSRHLSDSLDRRGLVAVEDRRAQSATVLSASGAAPARLTLARFHAPQTCGSAEAVTELVLAFPPGGGGGRSTPPSHVTVVALLAVTPFAGGAGRARPPLPRAAALDLVTLVAQRAESISGRPRAALLRPLVLDPDQAADAGEVVVSGSRYAVGFRARFVTAQSDTLLITGVAATDQSLHALHWVMKPQRIRLRGGMMGRGCGTRCAGVSPAQAVEPCSCSTRSPMCRRATRARPRSTPTPVASWRRSRSRCVAPEHTFRS